MKLDILPKNSKVIIALSGGPDSVFLLYKLIEIQKKHPLKLVLAHANHGLRGEESNRDEKFCKDLAKKLNLPFESIKLNIKSTSNIEEIARDRRYKFLESVRLKHKAKYILTAHHLDDNLETFLMNYLRGSSLRGLRAMQIKSGNILRPLLYTKKEEILAYLKRKKIKFITDSSNTDTKFKRNYLRIKVMPLLKDIQPNLDEIFINNWETITQTYNYLEQKAQNWMNKNVYSDIKTPIDKLQKLDPPIQKVVISLIYEKLYGSNKGITSNLIDRALSLKSTGKKIPFGKSYYLCRTSKFIELIDKKPNKPIVKKKLKIPGKTKYKYGEIESELLTKVPKKLNNAIYLDSNKLKSGIYVRSRKNGDKFTPLGLKGTKKLQDFFTDKKFPLHERPKVPIFVDKNDKIVAISKDTIDEKYKITKKTKIVLKIAVK